MLLTVVENDQELISLERLYTGRRVRSLAPMPDSLIPTFNNLEMMPDSLVPTSDS